nr:hypothetical protein [Tanacetum cinerariifolium]
MPAARLTLDETEARSNWWISSRAYFDGGIGWSLFITDTSKQQLLLHYWYANKLTNPNAIATWSIKLAKPYAAQSATPYWQSAFSSHPGGLIGKVRSHLIWVI